MSKGAKVGCGCVVAILVIVGIVAALFVFIPRAMKGSEAYKHALATAEASPEVIAVTGEPIKPGMMPSGKIALENDNGTADLTIKISGPNGAGQVHVVGTKTAGTWSYSVLTFSSEDEATTVNLLPEG